MDGRVIKQIFLEYIFLICAHILDITSEECALRGCCWIDDKCFYPSPSVTNWVGAQSIYPELYSYDGGFSPNTCPNVKHCSYLQNISSNIFFI